MVPMLLRVKNIEFDKYFKYGRLVSPGDQNPFCSANPLSNLYSSHKSCHNITIKGIPTLYWVH
jgi:hypothetical protein